MRYLILGCGYLGSQVATQLIEQSHQVIATTTSINRLDDLRALGAHPAYFSLSDPQDDLQADLSTLLQEIEGLIVTIAPKIDPAPAKKPTQKYGVYLAMIDLLRMTLTPTSDKTFPKLKHLLYTSSTSVYGDQQGKLTDEKAPLHPLTPQAEYLCVAERAFQALPIPTTILRLGGLYGPHRDPATRLRQAIETHRPFPGSGTSHINLIHRDDSAAAIAWLLGHRLTGIYNLSDNDHPTRQAFYDRLSHELSLPPVAWDPSLQPLHGGDKIISSEKILSTGFQLAYPSYWTGFSPHQRPTHPQNR